MIAGKNRRYFPFLILAGLLAINQGTFAESWNDKPGSAFQIAKKKGKIISTEVLDWHKDAKDIPKDWVTLKNKYFAVSYPKCFVAEGEGGEDDPKISAAILIKRAKQCENYVAEWGLEYNSLSLSYDYQYPANKLKSISEFNTLHENSIKINGMTGVLFASVIDSGEGDLTTPNPLLRLSIYRACKQAIYYAGVEFPPGNISLNKIEKNDFSFPQDFKEIISTFKCPNDSKSKKIVKKSKGSVLRK